MRLSPEEDGYLRHWIYDEARYEQEQGAAKRLQIQHHATPADLALIIAASMPDPSTQEMASLGPPPADTPHWPWSPDRFRLRLAEARAFLQDSQALSRQ